MSNAPRPDADPSPDRELRRLLRRWRLGPGGVSGGGEGAARCREEPAGTLETGFEERVWQRIREAERGGNAGREPGAGMHTGGRNGEEVPVGWLARLRSGRQSVGTPDLEGNLGGCLQENTQGWQASRGGGRAGARARFPQRPVWGWAVAASAVAGIFLGVWEARRDAARDYVFSLESAAMRTAGPPAGGAWVPRVGMPAWRVEQGERAGSQGAAAGGN